MAQGDVSYPATVHTVLGTSEQTIYTVTSGATLLQATILACNLSGASVGYDLRFVPSADTSSDKHSIRGSKTAASGKVVGGDTEEFDTTVRLSSLGTIRGNSDTTSALAITLSVAEMTD